MLEVPSRAPHAIGFAVLLLAASGATGSARAAGTCPDMRYSMEIIDESGGRQLTGTSLNTLQDSPFKTYVVATSEHLLAKIGGAATCHEAADGNPEITLRYVYRPVIAPKSGSSGTQVPLARSQSNIACRLDSPWLKIAISRSPKLVVQAEFVWSERQFLLDQALMSGAKGSSTRPLGSLTERAFGRYLNDYTNSVLLAASPEARASAQADVEKRIPPDVLWLFRHAWQSTFAPFPTEVDTALRTAVQRASPGYAMLAEALVDRCFTSAKIKERYHSVFGLRGLFDTDQYRIHSLY